MEGYDPRWGVSEVDRYESVAKSYNHALSQNVMICNSVTLTSDRQPLIIHRTSYVAPVVSVCWKMHASIKALPRNLAQESRMD